eukprot:928138-Amorphochlora_amoeboformis.AAC.1
MASEGSSDGPPTSFAQSLRARKGFEVEAWYPIIRDHTFYTEVLPLSTAQAIAIVRYQRARFTPNPSSRSKLTYEDCKGLREITDLGEVFDRISEGFGTSDVGWCGRQELMRLKYSIHQCLQSSSRFQVGKIDD